MTWRLLVFDWDGTLMDSAGHIVAAVRAAAEDVGARKPAEDDVRHVIGLGLREAIAAAMPELGDADYTRFVEAYRRRFWQESLHGQALFPGAREVLLELKAAGYLLAVATGKGRNGLRRVLEEEMLHQVFDVTRCAEETISKPDPRMLVEILDELGLEPRDALMIGDTSYDLEMAARAGMDRLAVSYGAHGKSLLLPHNPLGFLDDIRDLPEWLADVRKAG
ncbi:MAG TPA: HAD-IA family hydrolase [Gammaproteobacteria bacterium]